MQKEQPITTPVLSQQSSPQYSGSAWWIPWVLVAPFTVLLVVVMVIPLLYLFRASFNAYDPMLLMKVTFTLENYTRFFTETRNLRILLDTVIYSLAVTSITLILGFPLAYWLARHVLRGRQFYLGLIVLPFTLNTAVLGFGWAAILGQSGLINRLLVGVGLVHEPIRLMFNPPAVIVALSQALLPYMVLPLLAVISRIDPHLEEAAANLGAPLVVIIRRIVLPLSLPGILAGSTFVFLASSTAFVTPRLIGGGSVQMLGTIIYQQVAQIVNWPFAAALSFIMMVVSFTFFLVANRLFRLHYMESHRRKR